MVKRRVKRTTKKTVASPASNICENDPKEHEIGDKEDVFDDQEGMQFIKVLELGEWYNLFFKVITFVLLFGYLTWMVD